MNSIFFFIIAIAFIFSAISQFAFVPENLDAVAPMQALAMGILDSAKSAVDLSLGLVGAMALFLGLMKVAENGGLLKIIAKLLRPLMIRLFPNIPDNHPAMGSIIMNISANVMGLGNAATPFGIRAMQQLDELNPKKGTASDAMILFLAINTSSVTLLPTGVIALRASAGSSDPAGILPTTLFATACSTIVAVLAAKFYGRVWAKKGASENLVASQDQPILSEEPEKAFHPFISYFCLFALACLFPLAVLFGKQIAPWIIPVLVLGLLSFGFIKKVPIYESFVDGAKDGFSVALKIIPYLVAILVAVNMFRISGALDFFIKPLSTFTQLFGLPAEALPMALLRPLSGSGAYGILASIINNPDIGPDSYIGYLVSTFQGSTETTFYVIAVYFGAIQVTKMRYALWAALSADLAGILGAVFICHWLYG